MTVGAEETTQLVWDAQTRKFVPPSPSPETAAGKFIKGPLPLDWFSRAAALPGKALNVALALWRMCGLCRSKTFAFKRSAFAVLNVSPDAMYDALTNLEGAGLIRVERHRGRSPTVTIIDTHE